MTTPPPTEPPLPPVAERANPPVVERARNERDETLLPHPPVAERANPPVVERARNERDETPLPRLIRDPRTWLALYAVALTLIAFWPVPVDHDAGPMLWFIERLIPVLTYPRIEFLANIALFVPFGLLLTLILTARRWLVLPIAFLATVTIECLQAVALSARTPSVLDIIANTAATTDALEGRARGTTGLSQETLESHACGMRRGWEFPRPRTRRRQSGAATTCRRDDRDG